MSLKVSMIKLKNMYFTNFLIFFILICSIYASKPSNRIIGGESAIAGEFPFAAAIYIHKADGTYFCGGTLITNEWILTSANCILNAISFTIHLGSNKLDGDDPNRMVLATSEWLIHPDFDPDTLRHDVGLIKFRMPIEYTDYVRQIRFLPTFTLQNGAPTVGLGWGQISDDHAGLSNDLQQVNLTTIPLSECQLTYGSQVTEQMVCVVGNYNEGSCIGDMGSSLVQHVGRGYYLNVGVASFISGNGCESTDPSGYTRTFSYVDWIRNITSQSNSDL